MATEGLARVARLVALHRDRERRDAAALGRAQTEHCREQASLGHLDGVIDDYREALRRRFEGVSTAVEIERHHRFLERLDEARTEQAARVLSASSGVEQARRRWTRAHQRLEAMQKLEELRRERRRTWLDAEERKRLDELAGRRGWNNSTTLNPDV